MIRKLALIFSFVLIFTIPWEPAVTISSLGTLTRLIGFGAAGVWFVSVLINVKLRKLHVYHIVFVLFMLFNLASIFWTVSVPQTLERIKTFAQLAILTWLLWDLFTTPESLRTAMQLFVLGAYVIIISQLFNVVSGQIIDAYDKGRFSGAGQNAVEFALILALSMPLAWHLVITQKPGTADKILGVVNLAFIPLALLSTILTASRTSLITNIPVLLYILVTMNKIKPVYRVLIFLAVVTIFIIILPHIPQATIDRLSTIGSSIAENDLGGRGRLWKESFNIFLNHPFIGVGSNTLVLSSQVGAMAHNTFLSILAELGLVGIFLFLSILGTVTYQAIKQPATYSIVWITVVAVFVIGVCTLTWEYTKVTWFFLNLIIISSGIHKRQDAPKENTYPMLQQLNSLYNHYEQR